MNVQIQFLENIKHASTGKIDFQHLEGDFRSFDYSKIGKYNVYLFDGPHMEKDQYDGIDLVKEALDDLYFLIICSPFNPENNDNI
jgi:hypothetical protein